MQGDGYKAMTTTGPVQCYSCGAKIVIAQDQNGTKVPLNYVRVRAYHPDGCFLETQHLHGDHTTAVGEKAKPHLMRVSHFTTCPNAGEHSLDKL